MSADEIKALAQQVYCDGMSVKRGGFEHMSNRIKQCSAALLAYAAMVERCENVLKANARELEYRHKDADAALAYANYILRGDAGKEEK